VAPIVDDTELRSTEEPATSCCMVRRRSHHTGGRLLRLRASTIKLRAMAATVPPANSKAASTTLIATPRHSDSFGMALRRYGSLRKG
jgi:hypothetical protein